MGTRGVQAHLRPRVHGAAPASLLVCNAGLRGSTAGRQAPPLPAAQPQSPAPARPAAAGCGRGPTASTGPSSRAAVRW
jgi:hypothetical protein